MGMKVKAEDVVLFSILGAAITLMIVFSAIENGVWALLIVPLQLIVITAVIIDINWLLNWARRRDER